MPPHRIIIIRHGEKPPKTGGPPFGFTAEGERDADSLSARGWQRAGALAVLFAVAREPLALPTRIVAAAPIGGFTSRRNVETATPVAQRLGLEVDARFAPDHTVEAAAAILGARGPVLAVWRHRNIADLIAALTNDPYLAPAWDHDRFDVTLALDRAGDRWSLTQVPQMLLAGDSDAPLRPRGPEEISDESAAP